MENLKETVWHCSDYTVYQVTVLFGLFNQGSGGLVQQWEKTVTKVQFK